MEDQCNNNNPVIIIESNEEILENSENIFNEVSSSDYVHQTHLYDNDNDQQNQRDSKRKITENFNNKNEPSSIDEIIATKRPLIEQISYELVEEILDKTYTTKLPELPNNNKIDENRNPSEPFQLKPVTPPSAKVNNNEKAMNNCAQIYHDLIMESIERIPSNNNYRNKLKIENVEAVKPRKMLNEEISTNLLVKKRDMPPIKSEISDLTLKEQFNKPRILPLVQEIAANIKDNYNDKTNKHLPKMVMIDEAVEILKLKSNQLIEEISSSTKLITENSCQTVSLMYKTPFKLLTEKNGNTSIPDKHPNNVDSEIMDKKIQIDKENPPKQIEVDSSCIDKGETSQSETQLMEQSLCMEYLTFKEQMDEKVAQQEELKLNLDEDFSFDNTILANFDSNESLPYEDSIEYQSQENDKDAIGDEEENFMFPMGAATTTNRGITFYCENTEKLMNNSMILEQINSEELLLNIIDEDVEELIDEEDNECKLIKLNVDEAIEEEFIDDDIYQDCLPPADDNDNKDLNV